MANVDPSYIPALELVLQTTTKYEDRMWFSFLLKVARRMQHESVYSESSHRQWAADQNLELFFVYYRRSDGMQGGVCQYAENVLAATHLAEARLNTSFASIDPKLRISYLRVTHEKDEKGSEAAGELCCSA